MSVLLNQRPIVIDVDLAAKLGLNEAIIVQQLNYWLQINKKAGRNLVEGKHWSYNTIKDWHDQLPFLSEKTIKRAIDNLKDKGILVTGNFNKEKFDRTLWYTIDFVVLETLFEKDKNDLPKQENALGQNDQMEKDNLTQSLGQNDQMERDNLTQPIPEINSEITTKTNTETNIHIGATAPKNLKSEIDHVFEDYAKGDTDLLQALKDFVKMRKAIKSPLSTARAAKMLLNNLDKLANTNSWKIEILNQSILNNWKGVFELKSNTTDTIYKGNGYAVEADSQGKTNAFDRLKAKYGGD